MTDETETWRVESYCPQVFTGEKAEFLPVAGWVWGKWGLDFRVWKNDEGDCIQGWCLTHTPTGYKAFGIHAKLEDAQRIAEQIDAMADWSFTKPEDAKKLSGIIPAVKERFGHRVTRDNPTFGPWFYTLGPVMDATK